MTGALAERFHILRLLRQSVMVTTVASLINPSRYEWGLGKASCSPAAKLLLAQLKVFFKSSESKQARRT